MRAIFGEKNGYAGKGSLPSGLLYFPAVLFIYSMFAGGTTYGRSPNEQSRLELTIALARYGSVALDDVLETYGVPFDRAIRDGQTYSDKAPGLSLLGVPIAWLSDPFLPREKGSDLPAYWGLRHLLVWLLIALPAAAFPFLALRSVTGPTGNSHSQVALVFALATPMVTYSGVLFGHVPAGVLAALAWMLLLKPGQQDEVPSWRAALLAGLLISAAVTIEYPTAIVGPVMFATMALRRFPPGVLVAFAGAAGIGLLPLLAYHQLAFGSPFTTGYAFKSDWFHGTLHRSGLFGVTIPRLEHLRGILAGTSRGVLFYSPILALIPLGFFQQERQKKYSSLPYIALGALYLLFASGFSDWQAGWSAAARHLVPCIMIFIFPFAAAVECIMRDGQKYFYLRWLLPCAVALSLTGSLLSLSLTPFFPEHFSSPLGQLVLPSLAQGFFAPTLISGSHLAWRGYAMGLLTLISFAVMSHALFSQLPASKMKRFGPVALFAIALAYAGLIWHSAPPLAGEQWQMRHDVLRHIGYFAEAQTP
ncbi:MAG: hypothetical protein HS115_07155 [Spirochaetales bacterium]|nr:hypothetical protein [Spirochaetales bacterium]